jgi:hypothetical protein
MPLLALWTSNPTAVAELSVGQVVSTAGDGGLKDGSICSEELRQYFSQIPSRKLAKYIEQCLSSAFVKSGMVLHLLAHSYYRRQRRKI